jgi:hypothetical protein
MAPVHSEEPPQAEEVAAYVASITRELQAMVKPYPMPALAYLLELARLEAEELAQGRAPVDPGQGVELRARTG